MRIAFYDRGDVADPSKVLHTKEGRPRLRKEEVVIGSDHTARARVLLRTGRFWFQRRELFPDAGPGSLYHTSERFIFLRDPPHRAYVLASSSDTMAESGGLAFDALQWSHRGWKEGFSLPMEEITRHWSTRGGRKFEVACRGSRYLVILKTALIRS